jgi:hypothetical protein
VQARDRYLPDWLIRIRYRQIVLPRFQRMEAWGSNEVRDLLQTVLNGLPAGISLVLEVGYEPAFPYRALQGAPDRGERITEQLLDGQQRLTALWRGLTDDYSDRTFFLVLLEPDSDDVAWIEGQPRWTKGAQRFPIWANIPEKCWERRRVPASLLRPDTEAGDRLWDWALAATGGDEGRRAELVRAATPYRERFRDFNLPYLALPPHTAREVALDVFIKMNTRIVRLSAFDIVVAQVEEAAGSSLHDLVSSLDGLVPDLQYYDSPQDVALSASALLQDRTPNVAGWLGMDFERMIADWPRLVRGAKEAVRFLGQERILDGQRLPTVAVLPILVALCAELPSKPDALGNAQTLLRAYLWRAFFTDRYERAAATAAYADYRALRSVIVAGGSSTSAPIFDEKRHPLPEPEMLMAAGWPKKRDRLGRAILALSLRGGAYNIADGAEATREHLRNREYHHLFPRGFLQAQPDHGDGTEDRALNCALITWRRRGTAAPHEGTQRTPASEMADRTPRLEAGPAGVEARSQVRRTRCRPTRAPSRSASAPRRSCWKRWWPTAPCWPR